MSTITVEPSPDPTLRRVHLPAGTVVMVMGVRVRLTSAAEGECRKPDGSWLSGVKVVQNIPEITSSGSSS